MMQRLRSAWAWVPSGAARWVSVLSFGFLVAALVGHGRQMPGLAPDLHGWLWLMLGLGVSLLSLSMSGLLWGIGLSWLGLAPRWQPLVLAYLHSNARKYLPGGIWHLVSRLQQLRQGVAVAAPVAAPLALVAVLLDPIVAAVSALLLVSAGGLQGGLGLVCLLPLLLLMPRWLTPALTWLERRKATALGLDPLETRVPELPPTYPLLPLLAGVLFVLLRFGAFMCCVMALDLEAAMGWGGWLAGFALAWTAGLVVPGAPAGLGVFEVVLVLRLGVALPEAPLRALAISYRLVVSGADLLGALLADADQRGRGLARLRN